MVFFSFPSVCFTEELGLDRDPEKYFFLNQTNVKRIADVDDKENFAITQVGLQTGRSVQSAICGHSILFINGKSTVFVCLNTSLNLQYLTLYYHNICIFANYTQNTGNLSMPSQDLLNETIT